jgi:hypothetical protein
MYLGEVSVRHTQLDTFLAVAEELKVFLTSKISVVAPKYRYVFESDLPNLSEFDSPSRKTVKACSKASKN